MHNTTHGVFATRSPKRPNRIGMSVVKVNKVEGNTVYVENIDVLDDIISNLELKNEEYMDEDLRFYILNLYELNRLDLENIVRKKVPLNNGIRKL